MVAVDTEYIAIGCNRTTHAAAWGVSGLVAYGANRLVALYDPLDPQQRGVQATLLGHKDRVICVEFIERGDRADLHDTALVSGSADKTAIIWAKDAQNKWVHSATLEGHTGAVEAIGCLRAHTLIDETDLIATGSADGSIRVWTRHAASGEVSLIQVIQLGAKYPTALAMAYLPGSKTPVLASAHTDRNISVYTWQNDGFEKAYDLRGHDNWVRSLAFATYTGQEDDRANAVKHTLRPGDLMLASGSQDRYIRLWKISPHQPSQQQQKQQPQQTKQETQGSGANGLTEDLLQALEDSVATGEELSTKAHLITIQHGNTEQQYSLMFEALLMGHDDWVYSVCWERPRFEQGTMVQPMRLLSASSDKSMMIWKPDEHTGVWVNEVRMGDIGGNSYLGFCGALFSPDGRSALSHGANGSFHLWKDVSEAEQEGLSRWVPQVSISGHFKPVESVSWDPKGRFLLSASLDQTARLFAPWKRGDTLTWHEMGRPQIHGYDIKCISFVHEWQYVSGADEKVLRVFDAPRSCVESLAALSGATGMASEAASRPVGANLPALGLSNKAVFEGDVQEMAESEENHTLLQSYAHSSSTPTALMHVMEQPPFEEHLLQHTLWPEVEKLYGHGYEIMCCEASHDGRYIASACKAATPDHAVVRLCETSRWKELDGKIAAHTLTVTRTRFSHNDRWLLTVSRDRVWSLSERVEGDPENPYVLVTKNKAHARIIWDCAWSHDDALFATGSRDKTVKIWSQSTGWQCVATLKCADAVTSVEFAPSKSEDGKYILAVGFENGEIQLLSSEGEKLHAIEKSDGHAGVVKSLSWRTREDGVWQLASAGEDHAVRIYNIKQ